MPRPVESLRVLTLTALSPAGQTRVLFITTEDGADELYRAADVFRGALATDTGDPTFTVREATMDDVLRHDQ